MATRPPLSWLTFPVLATLAACSGSDSEFTGAGGAPGWDADLLHEIGSIDDPGRTLTRVGEVVLTDDGLLLIGQGADQQIRVHGPDGAFIRMIGQPGEDRIPRRLRGAWRHRDRGGSWELSHDRLLDRRSAAR